MKTAFDIGNNTTVIIEYTVYAPRKRNEETQNNEFKYIDKESGTIELKNSISSVRFVAVDDNGDNARIATYSFSDILRIFEFGDAILKEVPEPGNEKDWEPY
jgi:hypothetical protein